MVPGYQARSSIDHALAELRDRQRQAGDRMEALNAEISRLQGEEAQIYRDLARFRMEHDPDGLADDLGAAASRAADLLAERQQRNQERRRQIDDLEVRNAHVRNERQGLAAQLIEASQAHAEAEESLRGELASQTAWVEQNAAAQKAAELAAAARAKTDQAHNDRIEKGRPYEAEPLFVYLWRRDYGLPSYRASPPIRALDRWVAGLIDYQQARPNYAMLLEIPKRLDEHADRLEAQAAAERERLAELERQAFENAPAASTAAAVKRLRDAIADADRQLSEIDAELDALTNEDQQWATGADPLWREAAELVAQSLQDDSLRQLWRDAERTPSPEDEHLVAQLKDIRTRRADLEDQSEVEREALDHYAAQREELTRMAGEFRRRGWGDSGSVFDDDSLSGAIVGEILAGAISAAQMWQRMESGHRWRRNHRDPDFGGGVDMDRGWGGGWSGPDLGPRGGGSGGYSGDDGPEFSTGGSF